jgi:tetratricopeptide (TPR) repeat protein
LQIDFVDLLMGSFVLHPTAYVVVIATALASVPATAVQVSKSAGCPPAVRIVEAGALPVSNARLLAFGSYRGPQASHNVEAQRFFDQGLVLGWGFNFAEAVRSFRAAAQLDPECALCRWGIAWALGPSVNHDMQPADVPVALDAIVQARAASTPGSRERALIDALAMRYSARPGADTDQLALSYAAAMAELANRYADDADIAVLTAEAMMNAHAYDYWRVDGRPQPWTPQISAWLDRALALAPAHPAAHHYRIHLFENSPEPGRAMASAEQLGALAPIVGHLVHMPSHIFFRVGRYREAVAANNAAVKADHEYAAATGARSDYAIHNLHFLWVSALWSGDSDTAMHAADQLAVAAAAARADDVHDGTRQHFLAAPMLTQVRLHRWSSPPSEAEAGPYLRGLTQFARGMSHAARGDIAAARAELELLQRSSRVTRSAGLKIKSINPSSDVLAVARLQLQSAIATARGMHGDAVRFARAAVVAENKLAGDDPPVWPLPARHMLGEALLRANRGAEAYKVFSADLQRYPRNCVALAGLAAAERKQRSSLSASFNSSAQMSARFSHCPE